MDSSERASHNSTAEDLTEMKQRAVIPQGMTHKSYSVQKFLQLMQMVAQRSFNVFCIPFPERAKNCPVQTPQTMEKHSKELLQHSPPTVFIVNINNSTLTDCVIGDTFPCALPERYPLMPESQLQKPDQPMCSCCCYDQQGTTETPPPAPPLPHEQCLNISIHSSHLNYVIIGDNNRMHVDLSEVD